MAMKHLPSDQTMAIQKALNQEGYKLKDDGLMGKHTRAAIEAFQKKNALKITGNPDEETLAKLISRFGLKTKNQHHASHNRKGLV